MWRANLKSFLTAAFALAVVGTSNLAYADDQFDPTVDYRPLDEEFAAGEGKTPTLSGAITRSSQRWGIEHIVNIAAYFNKSGWHRLG